jgi:hypothetical protein
MLFVPPAKMKAERPASRSQASSGASVSRLIAIALGAVLLAGASQADQQATAVLRTGARGVELIGAGGADGISGVRARWS